MAVVFKSPTDVAEEYLTHLSGLRPDINTKNEDSDWWIRSRVVGGVMAGLVSDQLAISDDAFPQSARHDALAKHLQTYFDEGFKPQTVALGYAAVTGTIGSTVPLGTQFVYLPNGNTYAATADFVLASTAQLIPVQSIGTGQTQNILSDAPLTLSSPPPGINPVAAASGDISGARNAESDGEASDRILTFIRKPISGGTVSDYKQYALAADDSVVSANILRFAFGFGTVAVVITAGTTDIDSALDNDLPITVVPNQVLIDKVQAFIDAQDPVTDCATVIGPTPLAINVTAKIRFLTGDQNTVVPGTGKTQGYFVKREISRAIYKTPAGGKQFGGSGFVVASDMEDAIDTRIGSTIFVQGSEYQFVIDRQVNDLSATGPNRSLLGTQVAVPGVMTIVEMI